MKKAKSSQNEHWGSTRYIHRMRNPNRVCGIVHSIYLGLSSSHGKGLPSPWMARGAGGCCFPFPRAIRYARAHDFWYGSRATRVIPPEWSPPFPLDVSFVSTSRPSNSSPVELSSPLWCVVSCCVGIFAPVSILATGAGLPRSFHDDPDS